MATNENSKPEVPSNLLVDVVPQGTLQNAIAVLEHLDDEPAIRDPRAQEQHGRFGKHLILRNVIEALKHTEAELLGEANRKRMTRTEAGALGDPAEMAGACALMVDTCAQRFAQLAEAIEDAQGRRLAHNLAATLAKAHADAEALARLVDEQSRETA